MAVKKKKRKVVKKKVAKKKNGRPLIPIDWEDVGKLCAIQCTGEEIASYINIDYDTLQRACKREYDITFADYIAIKKKGGKASLRRSQWMTAQNGNATMQIWLGKNLLEQTDQPKGDDNNDALPMSITFNVKEAEAEIKITNAKPK